MAQHQSLEAHTALLLVDLQYGDAHPDYGAIRRRREQAGPGATAYYEQRLAEQVLPNAARLLEAFRRAGSEVLHTRIASLTRDGRDRSLAHRRAGIHFPLASKEAQILDEVGPQADEIVFSKTCASVFNGTNIEYVLRNLGVQRLVIAGVVTGSCVEMAVRDAADRGFEVILVEDATATWSADLQAQALDRMDGRVASLSSTVDVLRQFDALSVQRRT